MTTQDAAVSPSAWWSSRVGLGLYELMLSHAVLSTFNRLHFVAAITFATGVVSLVLIVPMVLRWGALGGTAAVLIALFLRALGEAVVGVRTIAQPRRAL